MLVLVCSPIRKMLLMFTIEILKLLKQSMTKLKAKWEVIIKIINNVILMMAL